MALLWSFALPKVENSLYFHHRSNKSSVENAPADDANSTLDKQDQLRPMQLLWSHFHSAYTNPMVLQWSLWYAIALAGYLQVTTYMQVVWKSFDNVPTVSTRKGLEDIGKINVHYRSSGMVAWMPLLLR